MEDTEETHKLNIITHQEEISRTTQEGVMMREDIHEIITAEQGILPEAKVAIAVQELPEEVSNRNYFF